jgi:hypothetical protein
MGDWNITIQGVGAHGNGIKGDIEQIYKRFIEDIKAHGHNIVHSSVTSGGAYHDPYHIPPVKEGE